MIYHDPTEARKRTRVPKSTFAISRPVANLEQLTGTDFLVDPYDDLLLPDELLDIPPHRVTLLQHCLNGVLIQRKSGRDLLYSIPELDTIQARMLEWSPQVWLVPVGVTHSGEKGVAVFGRKVKNWKWASVQGAYTAWRLRGGSVASEVKVDGDLTEFFKRVEFKVKEYFHDDTKTVAKKGHNQSVKLIDRNWLNTLSAWPIGIGRKNLMSVAKFVAGRGHEPSMINIARCILSGQAEQIKGWGSKRVSDVREWWGIDHGKPLDVIVVPLGTKDQPARLSEYPKGSIVLPDDDRLKPRRKS